MITPCMRSGFSARSRAMAGRAVLRMVPSRDCMKKAMATTHGNQRAVMASRGGRLGMEPLVVESVKASSRAGSLLHLFCVDHKSNVGVSLLAMLLQGQGQSAHQRPRQ